MGNEEDAGSLIFQFPEIVGHLLSYKGIESFGRFMRVSRQNRGETAMMIMEGFVMVIMAVNALWAIPPDISDGYRG